MILTKHDSDKSSMLSTVFGLVLLFAGLLGAVQADDEWLPMPNGMFHHVSCIYQWDDHFSLATHPSGTQTVTTTHAEHKIEPCAFKPRSYEQMAAHLLLPPDLVNNVSAPSPPLGYYSDWSPHSLSPRCPDYGAQIGDAGVCTRRRWLRDLIIAR